MTWQPANLLIKDKLSKYQVHGLLAYIENGEEKKKRAFLIYVHSKIFRSMISSFQKNISAYGWASVIILSCFYKLLRKKK